MLCDCLQVGARFYAYINSGTPFLDFSSSGEANNNADSEGELGTGIIVMMVGINAYCGFYLFVLLSESFSNASRISWTSAKCVAVKRTVFSLVIGISM